MLKPFYCLNERYCPVLKRNVAVETRFYETGKTDTCLYRNQCKEDRRHCLVHRESAQKSQS